jgi:hypothetical protein
MWTCSLCNHSFSNNNQQHYCTNKTVGEYLAGKTVVSLGIFVHLISKFEEIGPIQLQATKSMIVISADIKFAYIIAVGKNFVDLVLPFKKHFEDNLCFRKVALVPGSNDYNHHLRIMHPEDINEEVFDYLKLAYANGKKL